MHGSVMNLVVVVSLATTAVEAADGMFGHASQGPLAGPAGLSPLSVEQAYVTQAQAMAAVKGKVDKAVGGDSPLEWSVLVDAAGGGVAQPESATSSVPYVVCARDTVALPADESIPGQHSTSYRRLSPRLWRFRCHEVTHSHKVWRVCRGTEMVRCFVTRALCAWKALNCNAMQLVQAEGTVRAHPPACLRIILTCGVADSSAQEWSPGEAHGPSRQASFPSTRPPSEGVSPRRSMERPSPTASGAPPSEPSFTTGAGGRGKLGASPVVSALLHRATERPAAARTGERNVMPPCAFLLFTKTGRPLARTRHHR